MGGVHRSKAWVALMGERSPNDPLGPQLEECPVCGALGLKERIEEHNCADFLEWRAER